MREYSIFSASSSERKITESWENRRSLRGSRTLPHGIKTYKATWPSRPRSSKAAWSLRPMATRFGRGCELDDRFKALGHEVSDRCHWRRALAARVGDFYRSLVKDPGFQSKVNDIVIEFGTRLSQPILDRYIIWRRGSARGYSRCGATPPKCLLVESPIYVVRGRAMILLRLGAGSGSFVGELFR